MNEAIRVLLVHDGNGKRLLDEGSVRERLAAHSPLECPLELSDYDYCKHIFHDGDGVAHAHAPLLSGEAAGLTAFKRLFAAKDPEARAALAEALKFDVLALSPAERAGAIADERGLYQRRIAYKWLLASLARLDQEFVVLTPTPLPPRRTDEGQASRARELADWLVGQAGDWYENVAVFDLFEILSEREGPQANRLRRSYRSPLLYSRPNPRGADVVGRELADALVVAAERRQCPEAAREVVAELVTGRRGGWARSGGVEPGSRDIGAER